MTIDSTRRYVAEALLKIEAVKLRPAEPFTWASGWKSPIYCDNRKTLSFPRERAYIKMAMSQIINERYPEADCIAGVATGAISWGALVADALGLPFIYVRSAAKDHGMQNLIEGNLRPGARVVVIEDLISTGGSSIKAVQALKAAGAEVLSLIAVYTHGFAQAEELFAAEGVPMLTLSDYSAVIERAVETGYIGSEQVSLLQEWRKSPDTWGK